MTDDEVYAAAMAEAIQLGLMTAKGEATDRCQCSLCGAVFSTVANFDRHRAGDACHPPAEVGLLQHPRAWWLQPGPETPLSALRGSDGDGRSLSPPPGDAQATPG